VSAAQPFTAQTFEPSGPCHARDIQNREWAPARSPVSEQDRTWRQPRWWRPRKANVMSSGSKWPEDRRVTVRDLQAATDCGERWSMLTSYDVLTDGIS